MLLDPVVPWLTEQEVLMTEEKRQWLCIWSTAPNRTIWWVWWQWDLKEAKTNIICCHLYVESKKNDTNELIYKTEIDSQT